MQLIEGYCQIHEQRRCSILWDVLVVDVDLYFALIMYIQKETVSLISKSLEV